DAVRVVRGHRAAAGGLGAGAAEKGAIRVSGAGAGGWPVTPAAAAGGAVGGGGFLGRGPAGPDHPGPPTPEPAPGPGRDGGVSRPVSRRLALGGVRRGGGAGAGRRRRGRDAVGMRGSLRRREKRVAMMSRLTGKGVLVTGGGSGIGLAAARLLL